jgi:hypothetical protein
MGLTDVPVSLITVNVKDPHSSYAGPDTVFHRQIWIRIQHSDNSRSGSRYRYEVSKYRYQRVYLKNQN